jgi:hypothetical protein
MDISAIIKKNPISKKNSLFLLKVCFLINSLVADSKSVLSFFYDFRFRRKLEKTLEKAVKWSKSDEPQQKSKVAINTKFPVICTPYSVFSETSRMFWLVHQFHLKNLFFFIKKIKFLIIKEVFL